MSELLDKQVNAQKESLKKYFWGSQKLPQAHEKVCNENESRNKQKKPKILWKEGVYKAHAENSCNGYQTILGQ